MKVKSSKIKAKGFPPLIPVEILQGTVAKREPQRTVDCAYSETREPVKRVRLIPSYVADGSDVRFAGS